MRFECQDVNFGLNGKKTDRRQRCLKDRNLLFEQQSCYKSILHFIKCVFYSLLISNAPVDHDYRHYDICSYRQQILLDDYDEFLWQAYMFAFVVCTLISTPAKVTSDCRWLLTSYSRCLPTGSVFNVPLRQPFHFHHLHFSRPSPHKTSRTFPESRADSKTLIHYDSYSIPLRDICYGRYHLCHAQTDCVPQSRQVAADSSERQALDRIIHDWRPSSDRPKRKCGIPRISSWPYRDRSYAPPLLP